MIGQSVALVIADAGSANRGADRWTTIGAVAGVSALILTWLQWTRPLQAKVTITESWQLVPKSRRSTARRLWDRRPFRRVRMTDLSYDTHSGPLPPKPPQPPTPVIPLSAADLRRREERERENEEGRRLDKRWRHQNEARQRDIDELVEVTRFWTYELRFRASGPARIDAKANESPATLSINSNTWVARISINDADVPLPDGWPNAERAWLYQDPTDLEGVREIDYSDLPPPVGSHPVFVVYPVQRTFEFMVAPIDPRHPRTVRMQVVGLKKSVELISPGALEGVPGGPLRRIERLRPPTRRDVVDLVASLTIIGATVWRYRYG